MSKKVLVTKEFHRKALKAIEYQESRKHLDEAAKTAEIAMIGFMSYLEDKCSESQVNDFLNYMDEYEKEFGGEL